MKLVLLGTTGYHPNDRRQTACFMLPELGVVFDAGTGFYRVSDYLETDSLDVFLSHVHLDHSIGLTYMFDVRYRHPLKRVTAYVEDEKLEALRQHLLAPLLFPVEPPIELRSLPAEVTLADGSRLTHFPLRHPGGSVGFRIDWPDRSMAYVTDTVAAADADYVKHVCGVDLLVHECYFNDDQADQAELTGHSCLSCVAEVAAKAQVGRLVLVHINPLLDDDAEVDLKTARKIFAKTEIGVDRMEIEF
ncbi:MAG: MBL fold metallo-hydrolase [Pirellulales bacterium]|nr:MBL fold metallo-hydrolase [Pirellulales bacterium]